MTDATIFFTILGLLAAGAGALAYFLLSKGIQDARRHPLTEKYIFAGQAFPSYQAAAKYARRADLPIGAVISIGPALYLVSGAPGNSLAPPPDPFQEISRRYIQEAARIIDKAPIK